MKLKKTLIEKAKKVFWGKEFIHTGEGLSRKELRRLEVEGVVEKELMQHTKTGQLLYRWRINLDSGLLRKEF